MSGLFRRNRRTRAAAAGSRPEPPAPSEPQDATATSQLPGGEPPLAGLRDLPAGLEPEELRSPRPSTERRARVRRRARYLRRVRELLLRDLGGLVYEIHRAEGGDRARHDVLVRVKAQRIAALDGELYALEERLGDGHPENILREPGVGGACPACGELHGGDAHFCSICGRPLTGRAAAVAAEEERRAREGDRPAAAAAEEEGRARAGERPMPGDSEHGGGSAAGEAATSERPAADDSPYTTNGRSSEIRTRVERPS